MILFRSFFIISFQCSLLIIFYIQNTISLYTIIITVNMASLSPYTFNNTGRIGADSTDQSQRNTTNTHYANYMLTDHFSSTLSDNHVKFAMQQPTMNFNGLANGNGIHNSAVDKESMLKIKTTEERPLEKLQLFSRPFITVPYLGRGSCDPTMESRLQQGEPVT